MVGEDWFSGGRRPDHTSVADVRPLFGSGPREPSADERIAVARQRLENRTRRATEGVDLHPATARPFGPRTPLERRRRDTAALRAARRLGLGLLVPVVAAASAYGVIASSAPAHHSSPAGPSAVTDQR